MPAADAGAEWERLAKLQAKGLITAAEYQVLMGRLLPGEGVAGPEPVGIPAEAVPRQISGTDSATAAPPVAKATDNAKNGNAAIGCLGLVLCGMLFWVAQCSSSGTMAAPTPTPIPTVIPFALIAPRWEEYKDEIITKNVDGWYGWVSKIKKKSVQTEISIDLDAPDVFWSDTEIVVLVSNSVAEGLAVDDSVRFSGIVSKADKGTLAGVSLWLDNARVERAVAPRPTATRTSVPTATPVPTHTAQATATAQPTATPQPTATQQPTDKAIVTATAQPAPTQTVLAIQSPTIASASASNNNASYLQRLGGLVAALQSLSEHQLTLAANSDQILDGVWTPRLDRLQLALAAQLAELGQGGVPVKYAVVHAEFSKAATAYVLSAGELVKFSVDRIFERLERSVQAEAAGNAAMDAGNAELDRLLAAAQQATAVPVAAATEAPAATAPPVATGATQDYLIVAVPRIVGSSIDAVDFMLGQPLDAFDWYAGDIAQLPLGGSERDYAVGNYQVWVLFNPKGVAQGVTVQIGLAENGYGLDQWPVILSRFGFGYTRAPDETSGMYLRWRNSNGYSIYLSGVPVDNLEVLKLP